MAWLVCVLLTLLTVEVSAKDLQPNIVYMLADDLGWNDVARHDPKMYTPELTKLARKGRELTYNYALPTCTPSRAALLTGKYPFRYGFQINVISSFRKTWLNEKFKLLPQYLKDAGYDTHMIGKWHLGYCNWSVTPLERGFDTFYGLLKGNQGYYNHSRSKKYSYDFRDQREVVKNAMGKYSTLLHTDRAVEIIKGKKNSSNPFFLYMAFQSVHNPWEAPPEYEALCVNENNSTRKRHCGMVAVMDEGVGKIRKAVVQLNKRQDRKTLVIFMSDNGGPVGGGASNYPLRGKKATLFEGGTRSYGVIYGPGILKGRTNQQYEGLIHITDWLPTLVEAAQGTVPKGIDGVSLWEEIRDNKISNRSRISFIYNMDERGNRSAARYNDFKLTQGNPGGGSAGWYWIPNNTTYLWEEAEKGTIKQEMMFDIRKDPAERNNLLEDLESLDKDYRQRLLFAKRKMTAMLAAGWKKLVPHLVGEGSLTGRKIAKKNGAATPGGWCNKP